jgi:hypothetical protein
MIWIKSVLVGLAGAILATVMVLIAVIVWMVGVNTGAVGSGGIGFVAVGIIPIVFLPAIVGFALGFWWTMRRERRKGALSGG